jgi:MFS family permease
VSRFQRSAVLALLLIFLGAHLICLATTLEDLDSINFALGVRHYDVAQHQPHPPGYPVFIAFAKVSTGVLRALRVDAAPARGLAVLSALSGTAAIPAVFLLFQRLGERYGRALPRPPRLAWWTAFVASASPLYWFTAVRPLSDMTGFCASMWAMALVVGHPRLRHLFAGAFAAAIAVGIRSQSAVLTLPLLVAVLIARREGRAFVGAAAAFAIGVALWAIPLLIATGGLTPYLHALGTQAGEDFSGVAMLWTHHTARLAAFALINTFVWPWDLWLGIGIAVLAAIGAVRLIWRAPRLAAMLFVAFAPYAVFHLLFQETVTIRYALPLLPVAAYAALSALEIGPALLLPTGASAIAAVSLALAVPASVLYAREGAPVFRAFDDITTTAHGGERVDAIGIHASIKRPALWDTPILPAPVLTGRHGEEWLSLVQYWRKSPAGRVWFVADPDRTDLQLFDPHARELVRAYSWGFVQPPFVGGARPGDVNWYRMKSPGWMLDRGWSITAEIGGITAQQNAGPQITPATALLKRRGGDLSVILGGRDLGSTGHVPLVVSIDHAVVRSTEIAPGFFVDRFTVPASALNGSSEYATLTVDARNGANAAVSLEQFDAEPRGVPMVAYDTGWHEPEYDSGTGRSWRWASETSALWVRPVGRSVTLHLTGESPLRYFKAAPHVRVLVDGQEAAAFDPAADFTERIVLPADALQRADGRITIESSKFFVPAANGAADQRHLALRIYSLTVE